MVLQPEFKEVVLAFVEAQLSQVDQFDDVIRGKGRGIILLLQGQPGVGKTLTAESVAEEMKRPLYTMSAGELGETPAEVEMNLQRTLELCTTWGAVLLLDECDVFLEKRSELSLKKNKLVAVFLRLLEYYRGVLFLTTNRISAFDPAFESRIHLTIDYPKLDGEARERIWKNFLNGGANETSRPIALDDLHSLSELDLNGRQIKNIVKTAGLLAAQEKCAIGMHHIRTVLKVRGLDF